MESPPTPRRVVPTLAVVYAAAGALLVAIAIAAVIMDEPFTAFTIDAPIQYDYPLYTGVLTQLVALLLTAAAAVSLMAWWVSGHRLRSPWLLGAVISLAVMADDLFLLHERIYPRLLIHEEVVDLAYFVGIVTLLVVFRDFVRRNGIVFIPLALLLLGVSQFVDEISNDWDWLEDTLKWLGIVTWVTFFFRAAAHELAPASPELATEEEPAAQAGFARARAERDNVAHLDGGDHTVPSTP